MEPRSLYSSTVPDYESRIQINPTLLMSWWATGFSLAIIVVRLCGRYVRLERFFPEDKVMVLSIIPLTIRMVLVHFVLIYGTNNVKVDGLTAEEISKREIGSKLVLVARIFYAILYKPPSPDPYWRPAASELTACTAFGWLNSPSVNSSSGSPVWSGAAQSRSSYGSSISFSYQHWSPWSSRPWPNASPSTTTGRLSQIRGPAVARATPTSLQWAPAMSSPISCSSPSPSR